MCFSRSFVIRAQSSCFAGSQLKVEHVANLSRPRLIFGAHKSKTNELRLQEKACLAFS